MIGLVTEAIALDLLPVQFIFCLVFLIVSSTRAFENSLFRLRPDSSFRAQACSARAAGAWLPKVRHVCRYGRDPREASAARGRSTFFLSIRWLHNATNPVYFVVEKCLLFESDTCMRSPTFRMELALTRSSVS